MAAHPAPQFGAAGTRTIMGGHDGPLIGTIIKPSVGLGPEETAALVRTLVEAGIDFIKDDELQANGPHCPFDARLDAVMRVIDDHADRTGRRVLYAVNITDDIDRMWRNLDAVARHGAASAMVCLNAVGLPGLRAVRNRSAVPIHGHRAGWGLLSRSPDIGIAFGVMQQLWRLAGADHLHVNGLNNTFTEGDDVVTAAARSVQMPLPGPEPKTALPVFSSGQTIWQVAPSRALLGNDDFIFCAGGGIMSHRDGPGAGVAALRAAGNAARDGVSLDDVAAPGSQLARAIATFGRPAT